jgi:hypothetical protein
LFLISTEIIICSESFSVLWIRRESFPTRF